MTDLLKICKDAAVAVDDMKFDGKNLGIIIKMVQEGQINRKSGKKVLEEVFMNGVDPEAYVKENGLAQVSDASAIEPVIKEILDANPGPVSEYLAGKEKNFQFLVGQSMRALKGKADPQAVRSTLEKLLGEMK